MGAQEPPISPPNDAGTPGFSNLSCPNPFPIKKSAAEQEWEQLKLQGVKNPAIDKLMAMVGLENVKQQVLAIRSKAETCKLQGADLSKERFNVVFQGNPGTGKSCHINSFLLDPLTDASAA
jgi:predicted AAA+ superfamily ATPase